MRCPAAAVPVIVLTTCALTAILPIGISATPAFAVQNETFTETIPLRFVRPSALLKVLQEPEQAGPAGSTVDRPQPKSLIPSGTVLLVPNDAPKSLTITGTKAAIAEMKNIVRLLDVRPRQLVLKTRLVETRLESGGRRTRTVLQTSALNASNNQTVRTSISGSELQEEISVLLTPHLNGDGSISLQAKLQRQWEDDAQTRVSETGSFSRFNKPNEWLSFPTMSFSGDADVQRAVKANATPPAGAYPLYRLEFLYSEVAD